MRVLQIVSGTGLNGAIQHCLWLTRELLRRGHRVTLLSRPGAWIAQQLRDAGLDASLESTLDRWPPRELRRIGAELRQLGIEVMHTHMNDAHAFGVLLRLLTGTPCVATAHNRYVQLHWALNDRVIAVSQAVRRFHRHYNAVAARRIVTVHSFLDAGRLALIKAADGTGLRRALNLDLPVVGYIGSVERRKGLIHLVDAMSRVPKGQLLVVGPAGCEPAYASRVERRAEDLGLASRIRWLGPREDIPEILAVLDLLALPSLREGCPLVVLEAMARGLPVAAWRS